MASSRAHSHHGRSAPSTMTRCGKCCYYARQVTTFLFSHIGLCTLLLGYALVGAFTFQAIESQHETEQRQVMIRARADLIFELSNMTNHSAYLNRDDWSQSAERILREFELKFLHAVKKKGYDGSDELGKTSSQWSFSGALLYSIIVITTIGYGNVAPRTDVGKIVTILYAIIGIPLMLFCLSNIGHAMAHSFKFIYWKCCCTLCVKPKKQQRRQRRRRRLIRQQRQRAMMALTQQPTGSALVAGATSGNGAHQHGGAGTTLLNGGVVNQQMQLMPVLAPMTAPIVSTASGGGGALSRAFSMRASHFRFSNGGHNRQPQPQPETSPAPVQAEHTSSSSFSTTPALTPLTGSSLTAQQVFFGNSADQTQEPSSSNGNGAQTKKSSLARSHSARTANEPSLPLYAGNQSTSVITNELPVGIIPLGAKEKAPAVICNRYASLSDDHIDASRSRPAEQSQSNNAPSSAIQLRNPPRRTPSQVRFMQQAPPDLSVSSPSPDHAQQSQQQSLPPPPFESEPMPPPPFQAPSSPYYFNGRDLYDNSIPPYAYAGLNARLKEELESDLDSDSDEDDVTEKNIPITVCLTLVVGYIAGGAWFFSTSEEWTFLDAAYFCFITLSTIGFGDLVPGRTVLASTPEEGQMTLAICALYLLFGMALLAMSLNLVKEKALETVRIIGERIGILVNDDDDYY